MKWLLLVFIVLMFLLLGCQSGGAETAVEPESTPLPPTEKPVPTPVPPTETVPPPTEEPVASGYPELEQALQAVVDAQVEAGSPGAILMVDAPDMGFSWQGAAGMADVEGEIPMEPDTPFRVSGITNTLLAALALKLTEEDLIDLDDPISLYLDPETIAQLNGPDGEPFGETITVRQLLNGTSGMAGYFFAGEEDRDGNGTLDFSEIIAEDPDMIWHLNDTIAYTTAKMSPNSAPGEAFAANDLERMVLGSVIETATGMSLDEAYQTWLFEPLGMADSFVVQGGDPRMADVAHVHYISSMDVSDYASLSWFSDEVVSTVEDLSRFMRAWAEDDIFTDPATKEAMMAWTSMADDGYEGLSIGLGILSFDFGQTEMPEIGELLFQTSVWNGFVNYLPQHNIVMVGTLNRVVPLSSYNDLAFPTILAVLPYVAEE